MCYFHIALSPLELLIRLSIHGIDMMKWINPTKRSNTCFYHS